MAKLRLRNQLLARSIHGPCAAIRHDARTSPGGHRDRRGRHHGVRGGVPVRARRGAGRAGRGAPHRPGQHRGEHGPADAGARRGSARPGRRATAPRRRGESGRAAARRCAGSPVSYGNCESTPVCSRFRSIYWTCDRQASPDLRRELARRHAAGLPGRWLSPAALKRTTGIDGAGGILTRGNAQVDPYRSCLGVARSGARRRRAPVRTVESEADDGPGRRHRHRARARRHTGGLGDRRDRICDAGVQAARRPVPDDEHLRHRDAAAAVARAPRHGPGTGDAVGHRAAVPLRALDARSAPHVRRPGSAEAAAYGRARMSSSDVRISLSAELAELYPVARRGDA